MTVALVITLIAAILAAGASFVNVWMTARLGRQTELQKWIRQEAKPSYVKFLAASHRHTTAMEVRARAMDARLHTPADGQVTQGLQLEQSIIDDADKAWDALEEALAEIELAAPAEVAKAARTLISRGHMAMRMLTRPGGSAFKEEVLRIGAKQTHELREDFVAVARASFGLDRITEGEQTRGLRRIK